MNPGSVRILGIDYEVRYEDSSDTGWDNAGLCSTTKCVIRVCTNINSDVHQKSVFLHEIIEALNYRLELKLDHNVITSLEAGLIAVFLDNPYMGEYLSE